MYVWRFLYTKEEAIEGGCGGGTLRKVSVCVGVWAAFSGAIWLAVWSRATVGRVAYVAEMFDPGSGAWAKNHVGGV